MRILFVDDDDTRHDIAAKAFKAHEVWHARDIDVAIHMLAAREYDLVCIDHDMADDGRTGVDVATALVAQPWEPRFAWVHSWNPVGQQRIADVLSGKVRHGIRAFSGDACVSVSQIVRGIET